MTDHQELQSPLALVAPLAVLESVQTDGSRHVELYSMGGLLSFYWSGDPAAELVVITMGGAMGGVLGPAKTLFAELSADLAEHGVGVMRVGYRQPGELAACVLDVAAAAESVLKVGARRLVFLGHSFGGAVAIQAAVSMPAAAAGVATFATQSAGCECAGELGDTPLILYHGTNDRILSPDNSYMVQMIAGRGDIRLLDGADHLLNEAADEIRAHLYPWILDCFSSNGPRNTENNPE